MEMLACPNLAVPAEVMQHVVEVESSRNPFAIGVVGAQLVRQPNNLDEAVATVRMLEEKGYNYSLGVAQVNRANLSKFGLDSYEKAFDVCPNLQAGSKILAQCYASAGGDWGKSFSCYYSGNFTTGYQDGYVKKVFDSMSRQAAIGNASPIPLQLVSAAPGVGSRNARQVTTLTTDNAAYRVAMRSVLDAAASATIAVAMAPSASNGSTTDAGLPTAQMPVAPSAMAMAQPGMPLSMPMGQIQNTPMSPAAAAVAAQTIGPIAQAASALANQPTMAGTLGSEVFVPQVRGPNDPVAPANAPVAAMPVNTGVAAPQMVQAPAGDQADLRRGARDDAFVF
ncbi:type IV secretion system protein VirB1 [Luteibacter sp. Sphag1AF]|nr:lytic transglycosylase domain-containing protein [Luteibacter sp. Sphag1AF]MBB3227103.1 type IV secretion system protein VirB1 [Luteibacter sp. Sphag1AF]